MTGLPAYVAAMVAVGVTVASGGTLAGVAIAALAAGAGGAAWVPGPASCCAAISIRSMRTSCARAASSWPSVRVRPEETAAAQEVLRKSGALSVNSYPASEATDQGRSVVG